MELTGDLSDFALTDILQILALSRKTGTLMLDAGGMSGRVLIEQGRITQASLRPGDTLADKLVRESLLSTDVLARLRAIGSSDKGVWTLSALLQESGLMSWAELESFAERHIREIMATLVGLEKGRFSIALNHLIPEEQLNEVTLVEGLEIGDVLLGAAKESDELSFSRGLNEAKKSADFQSFLGTNTEKESDNDRGFYDLREDEEKRDLKGSRILFFPSRDGSHSTMLCSFLAEMRSHSFEAEVSLLVMRYASEVASRGILFFVKDTGIHGLGQFGIENSIQGVGADEIVRDIHIPIVPNNLFSNVVRSGEAFMGNLEGDFWGKEILSRIGGTGEPLFSFILPIVCESKTVFLIYGDNYPGGNEVYGLEELLALVNQASLALEKIVLERRLMSLVRK